MPSTEPRTLFRVENPRGLPRLVGELQRLGGSGIAWHVHGNLAWVRTAAAPLFTLLRERETVRTFVERSAGEWAALTSPWAPAGQASGKMVVETAVTPFPTTGWRQRTGRVILGSDAKPPPDPAVNFQIEVRTRLLPGSRNDEPRLWLLNREASQSFANWLKHVDERVVRQLHVARGRADGGEVVALLARGDREAPPVLVLEAIAFSSILKVEHLLAPTDRVFRPPLRRDWVRRLFRTDADHLVWLDNECRATRVPLAGWRALSGCVKYEVPAPTIHSPLERAPLWSPEAYDVKEKPTPLRRPAVPRPAPGPGLWDSLIAWVRGGWRPTPAPAAVVPGVPSSPPLFTDQLAPVDASNECAVAEAAVRERLIASPAVVDWVAFASLARVYSRAGRPHDAATIWPLCLWSGDEYQREWLDEWQTVAGNDPIPPLLRAQANGRPGHEAKSSVQRVEEELDQNEGELGYRAAWLALCAVARARGGDALALARGRDRLFARLHETGLRLGRDVPAFVAQGGADTSERALAVREWLPRFRDTVHAWLGRPGTRAAHDAGLEPFGLARERRFTPSYADLLIAWGLARVGAVDAARLLARSAANQLPEDEPVHAWLSVALQGRIEDAAAGRPGTAITTQSLPSAVRYAVDRFRHASRILEPAGGIDAFSEASAVARALDALTPGGDRGAFLQHFEAAWQQLRPVMSSRLPMLTAALTHVVGTGIAIAGPIVDRLLSQMQRFNGGETQTRALTAGLRAAAASDLPEPVRRMTALVSAWLEATPAAGVGGIALISATVDALARLHMREELGNFLSRVEAHVQVGDSGSLSATQATGRLVLGDTEPAAVALDGTLRHAQEPTVPERERCERICNYLNALTYATVSPALSRIDDIFRRFPAAHDGLTTNAWFAAGALQIIDSAVRAAVGPETIEATIYRRWLIDDELRIRQRVQHDVDRAIAEAGA